PDFEILTDTGIFKTSNYKGKNIVIFFFPRADTSGCTAESIAFTNLQNDFDKLNCVVIGISKDNPKKQGKFREKYNLSCELGVDFENNICEKFGVWVEKSMYGKKYMGIQRATFLANTKGVITNVWEKVKVPGHAEIVLEELEKMCK
ncbi:MAG: peroxiredoxin, partial [Alphaproteobacteria bacterium]|nr:peroxiredoxin [Alphaproteobacteria bacterium]